MPAGNSVPTKLLVSGKEYLFSLSLFPVAENTLLLFTQLRTYAKR